MSWSWLRVLAVIAVVALGPGGLVGARSAAAMAASAGLPVSTSHTVAHAEEGIVADSTALDVCAVFPICVASDRDLAPGINASASEESMCRCESHMSPAPESGGLDDGAAMLVDDDGNDGDEYALAGRLAGVGSYRGAASDLVASAEQLPESPAPALPEDPPAT